MASTLLHPAGERDYLPALIARVVQLEATVGAFASLVADAYRAEGKPVPPEFAGHPGRDLRIVRQEDIMTARSVTRLRRSRALWRRPWWWPASWQARRYNLAGGLA